MIIHITKYYSAAYSGSARVKSFCSAVPQTTNLDEVIGKWALTSRCSFTYAVNVATCEECIDLYERYIGMQHLASLP